MRSSLEELTSVRGMPPPDGSCLHCTNWMRPAPRAACSSRGGGLAWPGRDVPGVRAVAPGDLGQDDHPISRRFRRPGALSLDFAPAIEYYRGDKPLTRSPPETPMSPTPDPCPRGGLSRRGFLAGAAGGLAVGGPLGWFGLKGWQALQGGAPAPAAPPATAPPGPSAVGMPGR